METDGRAPRGTHAGAMDENVEVQILDAIEDFGIERQRRGYAGPGPGREQVDSPVSVGIDFTGASVLVGKGATDPRIRSPMGLAPLQ